LSQLRHTGFLRLPAQQFQYDNCKYAHDIYALDEKGANELRKFGRYDFDGRTVRNGEYRRGTIRSLAHALQICDIVADLELGVAQHDHIEFMSPQDIHARLPDKQKNQRQPFSMPVSIRYGNRSADLNISPDAIVGLKYSVGGQVSYRALLIEANQNTEPAFSPVLSRKSHLREILSYMDVASMQTYRMLNLPNMIVLNVSVSAKGQQGLIRVNHNLTGGEDVGFMLYKNISRLGVIPPPEPTGDLLNLPWVRLIKGQVEKIDLTRS